MHNIVSSILFESNMASNELNQVSIPGEYPEEYQQAKENGAISATYYTKTKKVPGLITKERTFMYIQHDEAFVVPISSKNADKIFFVNGSIEVPISDYMKIK